MTLDDVIIRQEKADKIVAVEVDKYLGSVVIFENYLTSRKDLTPWLATLIVG